MHSLVLPWALSGATAVAVGFARFGYALILPAMQTDLGLSHAQAGWLNTANALGYLLGAIASLYLIPKFGNRKLFIAGLVVTTVALLATGLTDHLQWLALHRFLAGLGAAGAFITGGVLAGTLGTRAIVIFFSGGGLGMLATGAMLPWFFKISGSPAWPLAWLTMGAACVPLSLAAALASRSLREPAPPGAHGGWPWHRCVPIMLGYFLFGIGYIAYMTFIIAWLDAQAFQYLSTTTISSVMWTLLGGMTLAAPLTWRRVFNERKDSTPFVLSMVVLAIGASLPLLSQTVAGLWISAALVGASVFMVPSAVTGFIKSNLTHAAWGPALAAATCLFALGQTIGPVATGWVSDMSDSLSVGLGVSAVLLFAGAVVGYAQKALAEPPGRPTGKIHGVRDRRMHQRD